MQVSNFFLEFWIMQLNRGSLLGQFGNFASTWSNDRSSYKWKPGDFGATQVPRLRTARRSRFPIWVHASLNPPSPVSNPLLLLDPAKAATPLASARNPCSIPVLSPHGISLPGCARAGTPDSGSSIRVRRRSICRWYGNQHALIFPAWMGVFFFLMYGSELIFVGVVEGRLGGLAIEVPKFRAIGAARILSGSVLPTRAV